MLVLFSSACHVDILFVIRIKTRLSNRPWMMAVVSAIFSLIPFLCIVALGISLNRFYAQVTLVTVGILLVGTVVASCAQEDSPRSVR